MAFASGWHFLCKKFCISRRNEYVKRIIINIEDVHKKTNERNDANLKFKTMKPDLKSASDSDASCLLRYLEDLRIESEIKLSHIEEVLARIKNQIESPEEVIS